MRTPSTLFAFALFVCTAASAGTLFLPAYPSNVLVVDEGSGKVTDNIKLETGTPASIQLSSDHRRIYVTTVDHNGIEVIDVATHKLLSHFVLNTSTKQYRFRGGTPEPQGNLFYTVTTEITQLPEHFEVAKPKYTVVDLAQGKIVKRVDIPKEEEAQFDSGFVTMAISPDGKYLYQFGNKITILQASDFKVIDHIDLGLPDAGMENVRFGRDLDLFNSPGEHLSLFTSSDPVVHNRIFGLGHFNLSTREMDFKPIGPAPPGMTGLEVTPDKKQAYTIVSSGMYGNKRCEFWAFDLATDRINRKEEVPCRSRFTLGISSNGKKLYIYGAGFEIEVYDALTLKWEKTWDLNVDVTGGIVILDTPGA